MRALATIILLVMAFQTRAHPPVGIVIDSKGYVYYSDLKNVWRIHPTTREKTIVVPDVHTHELFIDKNDNLFGEHLWYEGEATDKWGHYVWKRSPKGTITKVIPDTDGFLKDYSFVRHGNKMFLREEGKDCQTIRVIDGTGKKKFSAECFHNLRWMTVSAAGNLFVVDHDGAKASVKKIRPDGQTSVMVPDILERKATSSAGSDQHMVMGLWTDKDENIFVAVFGGRMVRKITPSKEITVFATTPPGWSPTGGVFAPNGDLWLVECSPANEVRVERIRANGQRHIF